MKIHPVAKRYANALFETAIDLDQVEQMREEVNSFSDILKNQSRFRSYLFTPEVEKQKKMDVIKTVLKNNASPGFLNFLLLLTQKGRQREYFDVVFEFNRLYEKKINRISATVTSAVNLDESILNEIKEKLVAVWKADVLLSNKVDSDILGGFIIEVEGKAIDGSLRKQLELMKDQLVKQTNLSAF